MIRKRFIIGPAVIAALIFAIFGLPPFSGSPTPGYAENEPGFESGVKRLPNGIYEVSALTVMPGEDAEMVRWWFGDYMQTSEHYKRWHPDAHIWMDWENKVPGEYVGASHLVHEYIGSKFNKFRIQFVEPQDVIGEVELGENVVAVCATTGFLDRPINGGKMCHIIRNTEDGAEMRSRFWLGIVGKRKGNETVPSIEGILGNTYLVRKLAVSKSDALDLVRHAEEEMSYLAKFLLQLYEEQTQ